MNIVEKFDVNAYRNSIQEQFSGADGWDNFSYENPAMNATGGPGIMQTNEGYAAPGTGGFESPPTQSAPELDFTVVNTSTTATATCVMFGGNVWLSDANFGSGATITITPDYSVSYAQVLRDTAINPFTVGMIRMQSSNTSQVTQGITVVSTNIYGATASDPINMVTAISEYQYNNQIARSTKAFDLTGDVYFSFPVLASTTVTVSVYTKRKVNVARALENRPSTGSYLPPNTGIKPVMIAQNGAISQLGK